MKILMLANARAVHTQRWARALAERAHDVTVLSIRSAAIPGVRVITTSVGRDDSDGLFWPALGYLRMLLVLPGLLRRLRPDVVNPHYCITHGVIAALAAARPRVVNIWGSDVVPENSAPMRRWRRMLMRIALEGADEIVSTSAFMVRAIGPHLRRQPPIAIVPFGVDCKRFQPHPGTSGSRTVTVGWVKAFRPRYAPEIFLRAAAIAAEKNEDLRFVMVGGGPDARLAGDLAARLGLGERIAFPGPIEHERLPVTYNRFDIFVNSSRSESFGVVMVEAAACGLPVIATDVGGVREAVRVDETAIIVPPDNPQALADSILRLAAAPELRQKLGRAGRAFVARSFQWQSCVTAFEAALARAVSSRERSWRESASTHPSHQS